MTTPTTRLRVYSHTLLHQPPDPGRWRFGYLAAPSDQLDHIRVSRAVAEQICQDLARLRTEAIEDAMADAEFYEDALSEADAALPRIYFDGEHLVADWRHVTGNSDALRSTDPDSDGWYTVTLGLSWQPVPAGDCDTVRDDNTATSPDTAAYQAYVGLFTDPVVALLDLARRAGIAVAYLDRAAIEADTRPLTDDEWHRITYYLDDYDEHVCGSVDVNAAFRDRLFLAAGVAQHLDDGPDTGIK